MKRNAEGERSPLCTPSYLFMMTLICFSKVWSFPRVWLSFFLPLGLLFIQVHMCFEFFLCCHANSELIFQYVLTVQSVHLSRVN